MNRRHMLGTLGALAASAGCRNLFQSTSGPKSSAATANAVKLRLGFVGLCAFMSNNNFYDVGLIDPTGVKDPANENFHEHIPQILIDSTVISSGGTVIKGQALADLRLTTDLDSFRMWPLKGYDVEIVGLPTQIKTQSALTGAFPLRAVYPNGSIMTEWQTKGQFVHSVIPVKGGQLGSAVPRVTGNGAEKSRWKLTAKAAPDEDTWNKIQDLPRLMSDVVEYRTRVPENTVIKLILRADRTKFIEVDTTATKELEVWVVNQPADKDHTTYEGTHAWELQHVSAFYQLFNAPPSLLAVPTTNPATYPTSDPIFCPPAEG